MGEQQLEARDAGEGVRHEGGCTARGVGQVGRSRPEKDGRPKGIII